MKPDDRDRLFLQAVKRDALFVLCAAVLGWGLGLAGVLLAVGVVILAYGVGGFKAG